MAAIEIERHPARERLGSVVRRVPGSIRVARNGATRLLERVPGTVSAMRSGVHATTAALQRLPDSTLRPLAASSAGLGLGLYLAGKRRVAITAGAAPALLMGAAMALRPTRRPAGSTESTS